MCVWGVWLAAPVGCVCWWWRLWCSVLPRCSLSLFTTWSSAINLSHSPCHRCLETRYKAQDNNEYKIHIRRLFKYLHFLQGDMGRWNFCSSTKTQDLQQLRPHHNSTQLWSLQVQEQAGHLHWIHNYFYILATCLIQFYNSSVIQNIASQFNLVQPCKLQEWSWLVSAQGWVG